ncbi:hypothetical protein [Thermoflavimicrobium dichotomicum]|uniref:Uncharacterized protein n=1 Tax=Thermoflavimicrobium dichotomicum TaxID=46223 RepID=A0A1I3UXX6_9BACL|nr:hypothetical protein [Thermoflavimicrobium dichotomicum]SFJ87573.1 hypothetical protein SAMN05421852_12919 [Thermoflavimicrobium dichotomicum]
MLKRIPFLLWGFLLIFAFYNVYAYYLGQQVDIGQQKQMLEYWAWIDIGGRFSLFMIGLSGISWLFQNRSISFLAKSLVTSLGRFGVSSSHVDIRASSSATVAISPPVLTNSQQ